MLLTARTAVDASTPSDHTDTPLLVARAPAHHSDSDDHRVLSIRAGTDGDLSASSRRAVFLVLGVVLGIIFVVMLILGFTCTLKHCQRLRHAGQSIHRIHFNFGRSLLPKSHISPLTDPEFSVVVHVYLSSDLQSPKYYRLSLSYCYRQKRFFVQILACYAKYFRNCYY